MYVIRDRKEMDPKTKYGSQTASRTLGIWTQLEFSRYLVAFCNTPVTFARYILLRCEIGDSFPLHAAVPLLHSRRL